MAEAVVTQEEGTLRTEETQQTTTEQKPAETPKQETLSDVEARYRSDFDKKHGRDVKKLFPNDFKEKIADKKEEPKPEAKKEDEKKADTQQPTTEAAKPKNKNGYARHISRLNREIGELKGVISMLKQGTTTPKVEEKKEPELVEPKREDFATVEEYITAIRKYDREVTNRDVNKTKTEITQTEADRVATERWNNFVAKREEVKKTLPDWDQVIDNCEVEFEPALHGIVLTIGSQDPKFFYDLAKDAKGSRALNKLSEQSVGAIGSSSDDISGVMRYLAKHPDDITRLNDMVPVKAAKFVGIIESKLEASAVEKPKTEEKAPLPAAKVASQDPPKDVKKEEKSEQVQEKPAMRARPEPPPKISGSAPPATDWRETSEMSLADRERLWQEDPRNRRR